MTTEKLLITEFTLCQGIEPEVLAAWPCATGGVDECEDRIASKSFICSRPKNHTGPHVAYGGEFTVCAAWPDLSSGRPCADLVASLANVAAGLASQNLPASAAFVRDGADRLTRIRQYVESKPTHGLVYNYVLALLNGANPDESSSLKGGR